MKKVFIGLLLLFIATPVLAVPGYNEDESDYNTPYDPKTGKPAYTVTKVVKEEGKKTIYYSNGEKLVITKDREISYNADGSIGGESTNNPGLFFDPSIPVYNGPSEVEILTKRIQELERAHGKQSNKSDKRIYSIGGEKVQYDSNGNIYSVGGKRVIYEH